MSELTNQTVKALYKTGSYYGRVIEDHPTKQTVLVEILAVEKHPVQGDLHHPKEVNVPLFHERKALSFREKANMPRHTVKPFDSEIPEYNESLKHSLETMKTELKNEDTDWSFHALKALEAVEKDYPIA
ncbi:kinase-associated lipoprotein B [Salisediminibacterium beveridgei]|uniref:KapB, lipoprotein required for KinB pathway to sporulation n=1 Tax=Salisediminibacterium beveridgei TaxID=632773 RepID=A0A1D7QW69_9BACI|nr:kinase-associated lipoprotein B [Salisediminibacterium beveridgei]AOM83218.1 KapB, lipoprotein required for KinB pathway to sporulation [Salisediminibacterium beveridgei]